MRSSDQWAITLCLGCGRPLSSQDQSIGHRTKMYHNAACKQRYYRSGSYRAVQVFERGIQKNNVKIATLDASIAERAVQVLKRELAWLQEENARLEGEVARLTTLLEGQVKKWGTQ